MKRTSVQDLPYPVEVAVNSMIANMAEESLRAFTFGDCRVLVGFDQSIGFHLSISCKDRYPTWDEVAHARYHLIPNEATMAFVLPPMEEYVNIHDYTFHLWQVVRKSTPVIDKQGRVLGRELNKDPGILRAGKYEIKDKK
jgi:hypothetical protein